MALLWTEPGDVRARWIGDPLDVDDTQLTTLLEDIEDTASAEFSDIQARIDAGTLPLARVKRVLSRVVIRHLRNPEGLRQSQEQTGPYGSQIMYGGAEPGALALTDEDRAELAGASVSRAFTIDTSPAGSTYDPIVEFVTGADA